MKFALRIPIATKLVLLIAGLVVVTSTCIVYQSSERFETSSRQREDSINISEAMARATEVEQIFVGLVDKVQMLGSLTLDERTGPTKSDLAQTLFKQDRDLISLEIMKIDNFNTHRIQKWVREDFLKNYHMNLIQFEAAEQRSAFSWLAVQKGEVVIQNSSQKGAIPYLTIGVPLQKNTQGQITHMALAGVRLSRLQKSFSLKSARDIILLDPKGQVLAHSQEDLALESADYRQYPLYEKAKLSVHRTGQTQFKNPQTQESFVGAYTKMSFGLILLAQVQESVILEPSQKLRVEAIYVTGLLLSGTLLFILLGSLRFTLPIERLAAFTQLIAKGEFELGASKKIRSSDEVGDLALAFDEMALGLKERDKVKSLFSKFHGSSVAQDLISKDIALGGVKKECTIFFSDIRGFTSLSESTPAEEVVELLNAYFATMVEIITRHGGIVDKFIGDAIMAVWGAPTPTDDDAYHAVFASLEMRRALDAFNEDLLKKGRAPIKIGMGLHSGLVISGTIGSDQRMEYTVIGDTVNVASRIEASTKAMGADLLISDRVADKVGPRFDLELAGQVQVKGKSQALSLFKVRGYLDHRGEVIRVQTPYSDYHAEEDPKVKVA